MIVRYDVFCPGCNAKIRLRLGVGLDKEQPFYFVCNQCFAPTKGCHIIDNEKVTADLKLYEGLIAKSPHKKVDQTVTLHPDFPALVSSEELSDVGGSPFLHHAQLMGGNEQLHQFEKRICLIRSILASDKLRFQRLCKYYLNKKWIMFDSEGKKMMEELWPESRRDFHRHDLFHRLIDLMFMPINFDDTYPKLKEEHSNYITDVDEVQSSTLYNYAKYLLSSGDIARWQADMLSRLNYVLDNISILTPGFAIDMYVDKHKQDTKELRILRDEFATLKSHFVDSFELCHKVLGIVVGYENIRESGDWDAFPQREPRSLKAFAKLINAEKPKYIYIDKMPKLKAAWGDRFDRGMRNNIGHYSVRHDLASGNLVMDDGSYVPYTKFVHAVSRLTPMLLFTEHVLKMVNIVFELKNP